MSSTRSVAVPAIVTITAIIVLILCSLTRGVVAAGIVLILTQGTSDTYLVPAIAGQASYVLPLLAGVGVHLSATALTRASQRRTALVPVLMTVAAVPVLSILFGAVLRFVATDASTGSRFGTVLSLLEVIEFAGILLSGLLGIVAVIVVWLRGPAEGSLLPRRAGILPVLVVVAAILLVLTQTWLAVLPLAAGDGGSGLTVALRFLVSILPQWIAGAALMTLVTLLVAASAPAGRASAWVAASVASAIPVLQLVVSIPAVVLFSSVHEDRGNLILAVSALPVHLLAATIIIVFTLHSASRSRATAPHPDPLPR